MSRTEQIMRTWVSCKPQKLHPHTRTGAPLFRVERWQSGGQRVLAKTVVKTHSNNLVVLTHVQLKYFYRLSTYDVTHVRICTRPSPALLYCKRREAGQGLGNKASKFVLQATKNLGVSENEASGSMCSSEQTVTIH